MRRPIQLLSALCLTFSLSAPAIAEDQTSPEPVATIVTIKTPAGITRPMLEAEFKRAVPVYEKIPGLIRKYFIADADQFGGMYLWIDRASAEAWYNSAWRAKAKSLYGSEPDVRWFDVPVQIDNSSKR